MKPVILHFLPSVIRGVYRFDDDFSQIDDDEEFIRFVEGKWRFLPLNIAKQFEQVLKLDTDFKTARQRLTFTVSQSNQTIKARADSFFQRHPYFEVALGSSKEIESSDKYLEIQFVRKILARLLNDEGMRMVRPQLQVGRYFVDFAIEGASKYALEVDGFGKFQQRHDLDDFTKRQNYIVSQGWRIIRLTWGQVMKTPEITLRSLHDLFKADSQLLRRLNEQRKSGDVLDLFSFGDSMQSVEVVNDFYRVQDYFAQTISADIGAGKTVYIEDCFGLGFPFVATAISALYEFLQAIESVVAIDFDLPKVEVSGEICPLGWDIPFHSFVSVSQMKKPDAHAFDSKAVRLNSASVPTPSREAGEIRFRQNLSLNEINMRLDYFAQKVFGFPGTKQFQDRILQRVFNVQSVLGISATGSGKSFCFWMPALLKPGLTLVVCPLRSLMRDQRLSLRSYGIASMEFINSDIKRPTQRRIMEEARLGYIRLLYIAPERLRMETFLSDLERLQESVPINFLAVDEAHCISEWGHDFRPSYLKLPMLHETLSKGNEDLRLIALTATAGQMVEKDMRGILRLKEEEVIREKAADRERFSYQIVAVKDGADKTKTYQEILTQHLPKSLRQVSLPVLLQQKNGRDEKALGIVFCIFADPHGKNSVRDGIAHYLYETMGILEPDQRYEIAGRLKKYREDAYSTGKVRAFASKTPTLCPECLSYEYIADGIAGLKICEAGHQFNDANAAKPARWESLTKKNQEDFKAGRFDILVATKGFGMGIDKSSVRFVVHTSLSSGIESWYQEVGRAGRDGERAHIVLLVDPPNEACRKELALEVKKRPRCSYRGGCPHGKETLCDYGKQHMFITKSYPGAETDALRALRILDELILKRESGNVGAVVIKSSKQSQSRDELALYRLAVLGLIEDYQITYARTVPHFDVKFALPDLPSLQGALDEVRMRMKKLLADYLLHFGDWHGRSIEHELESQAKKYQPLGNDPSKLRRFQTVQRYQSLFQTVYQYLLLLLDHTYEDVVKMRYDMLWNLFAVVTSKSRDRCRREPLLQHFVSDEEKNRYENYRCGLCDVCVKTLEFTQDITNRPNAPSSDLRKETELTELLHTDTFDLGKLAVLADEFREYPNSKYRQARQVLEGAANNLPALFLARQFSPPDELAANAKRLLHTANQKRVPLEQVKTLYQTSPGQFVTDLLLTLNETDGACDCPEGWAFLVQEARKSEHQQNDDVGRMRECLELYLLVDEETLPDVTSSLKSKASELEDIFYA